MKKLRRTLAAARAEAMRKHILAGALMDMATWLRTQADRRDVDAAQARIDAEALAVKIRQLEAKIDALGGNVG